MIEIVEASEADIPALCGLLSVLFAQEREFIPDVALQTRGLAAIIQRPEVGSIILLREDGVAMGMVNLLYSASTALGEPVAFLEDMVVAPPGRGSGRGSLLLSRAIEIAQAKGCKRITLLTDGDNLAAQGFYRKHGFVLSTMVPMRLVMK